jgi:hypothetical protein
MAPGRSSKSGRAVWQFRIRHCADVDVDVATAGLKTGGDEKTWYSET